jgi:hypothetical protein
MLLKKVGPHYFFQPLSKIENCSFEGLKSHVSPVRMPSFKDIPADCEAVVNF